MDFVAIDVETANSSQASICQIGVVRYSAGRQVEAWSMYVDPEDHFDKMNVSIHGITETTVAGAPRFPTVFMSLRPIIEGAVVVSHTKFDHTAVHQAADRYGLVVPTCGWLDSCLVARHAWPDVGLERYGLADVCKMLGYQFKHHDALEDAKAAAHIVMMAAAATSTDLDGLLERVEQPMVIKRPSGRRSAGQRQFAQGAFPPIITRPPSSVGVLANQVVVFTGNLKMTREEAADAAASHGASVAAGVTKKTTMLVVGTPNMRLQKERRSIKRKRAEELIAQGQSIQILSEKEFARLVCRLDRRSQYEKAAAIAHQVLRIVIVVSTAGVDLGSWFVRHLHIAFSAMWSEPSAPPPPASSPRLLQPSAAIVEHPACPACNVMVSLVETETGFSCAHCGVELD